MTITVCVCASLNPIIVLHTLKNESDPCDMYTVLNDTWRATSKDGSPRCDSNVQWQGWYRMFHQGASVLMPNVCVPYLRCGTHAPLWLNGSHPRPEDGIVIRQVCGSYQSGCCQFKPPSIQVKACPGNYTVYKLVAPHVCNLAYCTGKMLFSDIVTIVCLCPCYIHHCFSWEKIFISHIYYLKHISIRHADVTPATTPAAVTSPVPTTPSK